MYPEPPAGERGDRVPAAPDHFVPRWQEFADAVWLAAHWSRCGGPGGTHRQAPPTAPEGEAVRPRDSGTGQPSPPPADDDALAGRPAADEEGTPPGP
ncbi:hypothetical protein C1J00_32565, partial [Streptomyces cahuitamycinicus]